jgi:hypothetical protein
LLEPGLVPLPERRPDQHAEETELDLTYYTFGGGGACKH